MMHFWYRLGESSTHRSSVGVDFMQSKEKFEESSEHLRIGRFVYQIHKLCSFGLLYAQVMKKVTVRVEFNQSKCQNLDVKRGR